MKEAERIQFSRREFLKKAGVAAAGLGLITCAPAAAPAPTPTTAPTAPTLAAKAPAAPPTPGEADMAAKLYEAAKKEGTLMVYTTGTAAEWEETKAAFQKKYPGIAVEAYPGGGDAILDKVLTEARAKKLQADWVRCLIGELDAYAREGLVEPYLSPETRYLPSGTFDPKGGWVYCAYLLDVVTYNTEKVSERDVPAKWEDFLDPKYTGKLGLEADAIEWFTSMLKIMGKEKGIEFMRGLAKNKPRLVKGHATLANLVISGEVPMAVYNFHFRAYVPKQKGAPVNWRVLEPAPVASLVDIVLKGSPHPSSGKLFHDFYLSADNARLLLKQGFIPYREGVELGEQAQFRKPQIFVLPAEAGQEINENRKLFRQIFGVA